jgi:polysaccharide pyruvyl transferase WcaK-like protein
MFRSTAEALNVPITTTITETLSRIADMEVMIAMRLHAAILASSSGIPTLVLSYWSKTREFAQLLSLPCIDAHDFSLSLLETEFDILLTQRRSLRTELILRTQSIAEQGKKSLHTSLLEIDRAWV